MAASARIIWSWFHDCQSLLFFTLAIHLPELSFWKLAPWMLDVILHDETVIVCSWSEKGPWRDLPRCSRAGVRSDGPPSGCRRACSPFSDMPATSLSGMIWLSLYLIISWCMSGGSLITQLTFLFLLDLFLDCSGSKDWSKWVNKKLLSSLTARSSRVVACLEHLPRPGGIMDPATMRITKSDLV